MSAASQSRGSQTIYAVSLTKKRSDCSNDGMPLFSEPVQYLTNLRLKPDISYAVPVGAFGSKTSVSCFVYS